MAELNCPVDFVTVNENKVRLTALLVFILALIYLFIGHWTIPAFLMIDFYMRGFNNGNYSPLGWLSGRLERIFMLPQKPVDRAPKRFAAQVGFIFGDMLFIASIIGLSSTGFYIALPLLVFSFLESFAGICVGCHVHSFLQKLKPLKSEDALPAPSSR